MKILHFADLHIGYENYGKIDPKTGLSTRLLDFLKAFDRIVDYTLKEDIDLVVFAGDAFKTRDPSPTYQREFSKRIKKIANKIPIVLITGNHDIPPSFGKADTLEIYPTLEVPNVHVFSKPRLYQVPVAKSQVQILALPWIPRANLIKEEERKKSIEEIRDILSQIITEIFQELTTKIDPKKPAIGLVHQSVSGALFASNQQTYIGNDPLIPVSLLANPKLSYVALGHLHKYQILNDNPPVIYSGSPERVDFGEEKDKKGFVVADIEVGKKTKFKFIELPSRKFITIDIKMLDHDTNPNKFIINQIKKHDVKDAIVRVVIEGKETQISRIIDSDLKDLLKSAYFIASISKKSEKRTTKIEIIDEDLDMVGWLEKYLKNKGYDKNHAKSIEDKAKILIEEMGINF